MGLKEFLVSVKDSLAELPTRKKVHIVIGNESCDLDSTVSAIVYAYFLHQIKAKPGTSYVPVLNVPRQSFHLRLETVYILGKHGIREQDLTFVSDLDLAALTPRPPGGVGGGSGSDATLAVTLVDHHVLSERETCLAPYVEQVFDHRPQDGPLPDSWIVILEHVGSCCSLIAREIFASELFELDSVTAELLLGTILTDTGNMSASDHIGTPGDHEQLVRLKAFLPPSISATGIYEEIQRAKFDLSSLTVREMLEKDMKMVKGTDITVAMCSVNKDLEDILSDPDMALHAREFCEELPAHVVIIMTIVMGDAGIRRRCIGVYAPNRVYREQITDVIERSTAPNLELEPLDSTHEDLIAFVQNNVRISRKGVLPLVRDFLTGEVTTSSSTHDFFSSANFSENASASSPGEGDKAQDKSPERKDEEMRRHINLAKAYQSEQFRTSQDRYDLAAVGTSALISPSLSSDSDLGNLVAADSQQLSEFSLSHPDLPIADYLLAGPPVQEASGSLADVDSKSRQKVSGKHVKSLKGSDDLNSPAPQGPLLIDFDGGGDNADDSGGGPRAVINPDDLLMDAGSGDRLVTADHGGVGEHDSVAGHEQEESGGMNGGGGNADTPPIVINCHTPFELMCPANIADTMMTDFFSSSMPTSGQGSKVPSYPETPPNSYMGSSFSLNRETQLPSFNSSEMVKRIQQKKAALAGHSGQRRVNYEDDDSDGLAISGSIGIGSSGGGGSLVSPAVPQNSYMDSGSGFDFMSVSGPGSEIPRLSSSDSLMERVNEKRSQFEWSVEESELSKDGDENYDDINEAVGASGTVVGGRLESTDSGGGSLDPPVPYTPQNSYVEGGFDSYSRTNLPSMNSAEMVARIRAKQSAMFGSSCSTGSSSRVSRSSHGSDDSGGCRSPADIVMGSGSSGADGGGGRSFSSKASRGASLDSPQQPYTPQNSYRDSMGLLEYRSRLPDLNEVAERLSTEKDAENSKRGKGRNSNRSQSSDDAREDRDQEEGEGEENDELDGALCNNAAPGHGAAAAAALNNLQPLVISGAALLSSSPHHQPQASSPRKSSSRSHSDSQNTMSDVDSLMSVSTDVGTPQSENVVATGLANQMLRGEMALIGRKDTTDSDVFAPPRGGDEDEEQRDKAPRQNQNDPDRPADSKLSNEEKRKHLKFSLNQEGKRVVIPNGPVAEEDLVYLSDIEHTGGFHTHSLSKDDLFSPVEPNRGDERFVNIAENIVAESIAAALHLSTGRGGSQVQWTDQISSEALVSPENVVAANLSASILHEGSDRWGTEEKLVSRSAVQDMIGNLSEAGSKADLVRIASSRNNNSNRSHHHQHQGGGGEEDEDPEHNDGSLTQAPAENPDQTLSDVALNELAYEIANELIQNVLENFPEISNQLEAQDGEHNRASQLPAEADATRDSRGGGISPRTSEDYASGGLGEEMGDMASSSEPRKYSLDSNSSASTSCSDRKWSRDTDSTMTIIEDEVLTSFPDRPDQEEEIKSFPGRKFSKSEDFPARRFSREEHASRRTSKIGEQGEAEEDIKVAPDGLETDYLPNMDPLQGNLDIIDASFSKITDADREVVEGESFRKVSGQEFGISSHFQEDEDEEGASEEKNVENEEDVLVGRSQDIAGSRSSESVERGIMKKEKSEDSIFDEDGNQVAVAKAPRTKKRIRVSFSEDIEDEAGDSNSSCATPGTSHSPSRSVLRSPPPFAQFEDSERREGDEGEGLDVAAADDDDDGFGDREASESDVFLSSAAERPEGRSRPSREVYHTTAGRISLPSGEDSDRAASLGSVSSPAAGVGYRPNLSTVASTRDQHQVGNQQQQPGSAGDPDVFGVTPGARATATTSSTTPDPLAFFQPPESYSSSSRSVSVETAAAAVAPPPPPSSHHQAVLANSSVQTTRVTPDPDPSVNPDLCCVEPAVISPIPAPVYCATSQSACSVAPTPPPQQQTDNASPPHVASSVSSTETAARGADNSSRKLPPKSPQLSGPQPATSDPLTSGREISSSSHSRNLSSASYGSVKGAVYSEEWQDDDIAGMAAQAGIDVSQDDHQRRKIRPDPNFARHIADYDDEEDEEEDEGIDDRSDIGDLEWENDTPIQPPQRPGIQPTLSQDGAHPGQSGAGGAEAGVQAHTSQRWKRVSVSGTDFNIDLRAVEPYRSVLSHGGYYAEGLNAIIVFYGCNLPSRRREDYSYVMNHLFHYVVHTLEELVADDYVIVYFHGSTPRHKMPGLGWLRRCYQSIDRRLKKNLKGLFLVHPTLWLRTIVTMTRPFISSKFSSKLRFVRTLEELNAIVPMDNVTIPDAIAQLETVLRSNPHYLEEQDERERRETREEKAKAKREERERKRQEKLRRKEEKEAASEEKRRQRRQAERKTQQ